MSIKYMSIYRDISEKISEGQYPTGMRLPSESELMKAYDVSRQTVRSALAKLRQEGLVKTSQGSGAFVDAAHAQLHSGRVALIMFQTDVSAFPIIVQNIEQYFSEREINLMLFVSNASITKEKRILERLLADPVDGILFYPLDSQYECLHTDLLNQLDKQGTRILFVEARYADPAVAHFPYVAIDNYGDAYKITTRLIDEGNRKIGCIGFFHGQIGQRYCGMRKALYDHDVPLFYSYDLSAAVHGAGVNQTDSNYSMRTPIFDSKLLECTALICFNDTLAETITAFLQQNGRGNIETLVIYGNTAVPHIDGIRYILLHHNTELIARLAAEKILKEINGSREASEIIPFTVIG